MKKILIFLILALLLSFGGMAQDKVKSITRSVQTLKIGLQNYSTSYDQTDNDTTPFLVTAIPYNGVYSNFTDMNVPDSSLMPISTIQYLSPNSRRLYTYDSAEVVFLAPYIKPVNSNRYEYRVTVNGKKELTPWSDIDKFTDSSLVLGTFPKTIAFLGSYKTTWDNFLLVELREKGKEKDLSTSIVYWKQTRPVIATVYTSKDFNEFLKMLKRPWDRSLQTPALPSKLVIDHGENNIIFYLAADIMKKEALEYELLRNDKVKVDWRANDFDNNFIWLRDLPQGIYRLHIRYTKQRHNVTDYSFEVKPLWYETALAKIIAAIISIAAIGSIFLVIRVVRQKEKLQAEQQKKEKIEARLRAVRSQLNPHFVFNALASIQGLINSNNLAAANRYLSDFALLMRNTLAGSNKDNNNLSSELKMLSSYLQLEQMRFQFNCQVNVDESLDGSAIEIPSLLLQPLVENAVKHGVSGMEQKGMIRLDVLKEKNNLLVLIRDNGKGLPPVVNDEGYGLKLTKDRIALLNQVLNGQSIELELESQAGNGTTVHLHFNNWLS